MQLNKQQQLIPLSEAEHPHVLLAPPTLSTAGWMAQDAGVRGVPGDRRLQWQREEDWRDHDDDSTERTEPWQREDRLPRLVPDACAEVVDCPCMSSRHERGFFNFLSCCRVGLGDRQRTPLSPLQRLFRAMASAVRPDAQAQPRAVRVVAAGTLFVVNTLSLDGFPDEGSSARAKNVVRTRGGTAPITLAVLAQLGRQEAPRGPRQYEQRGRAGAPEPAEPAIEAYLVAALGGDDDGRLLIRELHDEGVSTKFSKILDRPVPTSWVFLSESTQTRTVVHHNSIPDITHVEFVELLGPLLIPENYSNLSVLPPPPPQASPRPSFSSQKGDAPAPVIPELPMRGPGSAPFDVLLFEARSVPQTLSNMQALDGLARERGWRHRVAICLELSRSDRQGVEILIRNADAVFFSKAYATGRGYSAPRPFLLSMVTQAAPHALLVVNWGSAGAALLSVPTSEYFQSSGWSEPLHEKVAPPPVPRMTPQRPQQRSRSRPPASGSRFAGERRDLQSVRSGSQFWADGRGTPGTGTGTASLGLRDWDLDPQGKRSEEMWRAAMRQQDGVVDEDDDDSHTEDGTGIHPPAPVPMRLAPAPDLPPDETGAQNAFVAGMLYALTKRVLPGAPYSPVANPNSWHPRDGPWRLEECLKFATELAGRKARRPPGSYDGLAHELRAAGWFAA